MNPPADHSTTNNHNYNYVVTAHKPTAVTHAMTGHFTSREHINLIIGKCTMIEIHRMGPEGIVPMVEVPIYGRITSLQLFRPSGEEKDLLFISTERYHMCILSYEDGQLVTRAAGDMHDRIGKPTENGQIGIVDPQCRAIALHLYEGLLKVIPYENEQKRVRDAFNLRLEELSVIDIQFLHESTRGLSLNANTTASDIRVSRGGLGGGGGSSSGSSSSGSSSGAGSSSSVRHVNQVTYSTAENPVIAILHEDAKGARHVKTYTINMKDKDFTEGPFQQPNVESGATHLISVPFGGIIIVGEYTITYHDGSQYKSFELDRPTSIRSYGQIDPTGERWLLGDHEGQLYMLQLLTDASNGMVTDLKLSVLGKTSISSRICYLDDGYVFIGSTYGDSQLIQLTHTAHANGSHVDMVGNYTNLGPILDFTVADLDRQGQDQIITCSGGLDDGSIRIVRNGIGIDEQASIDMEGIKGLWSVDSGTHIGEQQLIILSFVGESRAMGIDEDGDLSEIEVPGLSSGEQTIHVQSIVSLGIWMQVTSSQIRVMDLKNHELLCTWTPSSLPSTVATPSSDAGHSHDNILLAASNECGQVLVSFSGGYLCHMTIDGNHPHELKYVSSTTLSNEVSCMDLSILGGEQRARWVVCGLWREHQVHLLRLPDLQPCALSTVSSSSSSSSTTGREGTTPSLEFEVMARSVSLTTFEDADYLLCALGDGRLLSYKFDRSNGTLSDRKSISLGTKPTLLIPFSSAREPPIASSEAATSTAATTTTTTTTQDTRLDALQPNTEPTTIEKHIFAASDRPTVIYGSNRKLLFSNVNLKEVNFACAFHCKQFPGGVAIAKENELMVGLIDEIQKLHIRTIPLGEQPKRISHHVTTGCFAVTTIRQMKDVAGVSSSGGEVDDDVNIGGVNVEGESNYVRLLDGHTFEFLDEYALEQNEHSSALICVKLYDDDDDGGDGGDNNNKAADKDVEMTGHDQDQSTAERDATEYVIVGTAYTINEEDEPTRGRILVFAVRTSDTEDDHDDNDNVSTRMKLQLIAEKEVKGAVYCMSGFGGKLLAGVNSRVHLFKWNGQVESDAELVSECSHAGHIIALTMQSRGSYIIVGDLMRSVSLLHYNSIDGSLEEVSRDYNTNWMTATEMLDQDTYIGAETSHNLFTLHRNVDGQSEEETRKLKVVGQYHLGDMVNKFMHGSLVMRSSESSSVAPDNNGDGKNAPLSSSSSSASGTTAASTSSAIPTIDFTAQTILFGTVSGSIGVIASIPESLYRYFALLQQCMTQVVKGVGNLSHQEWRSFSNEHTRDEMRNFIDGDLVENFLDLSHSQQQSVLTHMKTLSGSSLTPSITVSDVTKLIEDLQVQLH